MTYYKYISEIVDLMYIHISIINNITIYELVKYYFIDKRMYVGTWLNPCLMKINFKPKEYFMLYILICFRLRLIHTI